MLHLVLVLPLSKPGLAALTYPEAQSLDNAGLTPTLEGGHQLPPYLLVFDHRGKRIRRTHGLLPQPGCLQTLVGQALLLPRENVIVGDLAELS